MAFNYKKLHNIKLKNAINCFVPKIWHICFFLLKKLFLGNGGEQTHSFVILDVWIRRRSLDTEVDDANPRLYQFLCPSARHLIRIASLESADS